VTGGEGRGEVGIADLGFEFIQQHAGGLQVGGVEAFGEPAEDRGEEGRPLLLPALLAAQAGEARGAAQFPRLRALPARDLDAFLDGGLGLAHCPGAGEQGLAPEPIKFRFKRRSSRLFDRLQRGGDRYKRRFGLADRQLRISLQNQQNKLAHPKTVDVQPLSNLGQPLLAFAGYAERPAVRAKGEPVEVLDVVLLADPQCLTSKSWGSETAYDLAPLPLGAGTVREASIEGQWLWSVEPKLY
jgi:hypothetical protein